MVVRGRLLQKTLQEGAVFNREWTHNGGNTITQCCYCWHHFKKVAHESVKKVTTCQRKRPSKTNSLLTGNMKLSWLMHAYATRLNSGEQRWTKD